MIREETACLTGHRPKSLPWGYDESKLSCVKFKKELKKIFIGAINYGLTTFLTGMAEGFDMIATEILIKLRKKYKHIKIIAIVPCENQEIKWSLEQQCRYKDILNDCNDVIILSDHYYPNCMNDRNLFMIKNCNVVIACYNGMPSGTGNTLRFAKLNGCKIRVINPEDFSHRNKK